MTINLPPTLVINLQRHEDRRNRILDDLTLHGFETITVIDAVDHQDLTAEPPWNGITPWKNWVDPYSRRTLTLGEVGCSLSHVKAWEHIVKTDTTCIVLEDDAEPIDFLIEILPKLLDDLDHVDFELCYLSKMGQPGPRPLMGRHIHVVDYHPLWTLAYLLTPEGAKRLLDSPWQANLIPADELMPAVYGLNHAHEVNQVFCQQGINSTVLAANQNLFVPAEGFENSETEKSPPAIEGTELKALAVATENTDGFKRLQKSSLKYGFEIEPLGMDEEWLGGDLENGPGGGQKVRLLRDKMRVLNGSTPILFTDGYDVIINSHANDILKIWREKFNEKIVFASEMSCWPNPDLADDYPESTTDYRFLNSGAFIGKVIDLYELIRETIHYSDDDQLYYTDRFLRKSHDVVLDTNCEIFQCLNGALQADHIHVDKTRGCIYNRHTDTYPKVIHANGPTKNWLDNEGAAIGGRWRMFYGEM